MSSRSGLSVFWGCLVFLGVFVLVALVLGIAAYIRFPQPEGWSRQGIATFTGVGCAFFLTFAIGALWEVVRRAAEVRRLRRSAAGAPPDDGARVAALGTLVADGPLLEAPMSGTRSAIYKYEIVAPHDKSSDSVVCSGYGLTPCHIETAAGRVRILGYAEPAFAPQVLDGPEARARTQAYLAATSVTPMGFGAAKEFLGTLVDDDGAIKSDTGCVPDLANMRLSLREHALLDGETVCAFGMYSAARGGLVPDPANTDPYPVRLRRGDAAAVRRALFISALGYAVAVAAMTALAVGVWVFTGFMATPSGSSATAWW